MAITDELVYPDELSKAKLHALTERVNERYDEIKKLVNNSRMLIEQLNAEKLGPYNVAKSIEDKIDDDEEEYETSSKVTGEKKADDEYVQK